MARSTLLSERDRRLAVARRIEGTLAEIEVCECRENVFLLDQRARELIAELPSPIDRARLQELTSGTAVPEIVAVSIARRYRARLAIF